MILVYSYIELPPARNNDTQKMKLIDFMENSTNCNINLQPQDFFKVFVCIIMLYVQLYKNSAY